MKNKAISALIGVIIGVFLMFGYFEFFIGGNNPEVPGQNIEGKQKSGEVSDEQLEKISERTGLSTSEIKERLESGETMRDITGGQGGMKKGQ